MEILSSYRISLGFLYSIAYRIYIEHIPSIEVIEENPLYPIGEMPSMGSLFPIEEIPEKIPDDEEICKEFMRKFKEVSEFMRAEEARAIEEENAIRRMQLWNTYELIRATNERGAFIGSKLENVEYL